MLSVWQSTLSTAVILLALAPGGLGQYAYFTDDSTPVGVAQNLWHTPEVENARIDLADAGNRVVDAGQRVANQWSLGLESTKQRFKEGFDQISQNSNQNLATAGQGIRQRFDVISNILSNNGNRRQLADILATVLSNPVAAAGLAGAVANAVATAAATAQLNGDINETNQALDDSKDKVAALESTVAALTTRIGTLESGATSSQVCKNVMSISGHTKLTDAANPDPNAPPAGPDGTQPFSLTITNNMINNDVLTVVNGIIARVNQISSELTDISSCPA